jgi:hypothetical protein
VVSDIWRDTGGEGFSQFSYQYSGNRNDLSGRGPLGFASFVTIDRQTRFLKYQHLAQSYPLTGLTTREETHWYWMQDGKTLFKRSAAENHAVVCDFVVDPLTLEPYGTVLAFVSQDSEMRWRADLEPDASVRGSDFNGLEGVTRLFAPSTLPTVTNTTTSTWRDRQDTQQPPPMSYPSIEIPHPLTPGYDGATPRVAANLLRGRITHGNETRRRLTHQSGEIEDTVETFRSPQHAADPLTSQRETTRTTKTVEGKPPAPGPLTTYRYFADTTLLASETVHPVESSPGDEPEPITETVLERDERGRLVRRVVHKGNSADTGEPAEESVTYEATAFDDLTDQPTRIIDAEDGNRSVRYHPLLHRAAVITYDEGAIVEYSYDGFGRTREVRNRVNGYVWTSELAWTTPDGADWKKTQIVSGPPQAGGLAVSSVYAERVTKAGSSTITTYYDRTARAIRVVEETDAGDLLGTDTAFNGLGQTVAESKPYVPGGPQTWTVRRYDSYGIEFPAQEITVPAVAGNVPAE